MKYKILSLLCILTLIFYLCSCGNSTKNPTEKTNNTTPPTNDTNSEKSNISSTVTKETKISSDLEMNLNIYKNNCFTEDNNRIFYEDDTTYSIQGIDVSSYSGDIDWTQVKNDGIEFAIVRIGGRGYGESGNIYADETALYNINNAKKAGLEVGAYFYSQAITKAEAKEEAEFVITQLNGINLDLPIVYDFEFIENDTARTDNIIGKEMTVFAKAFCQTIEKSGYSSMIYGESPAFNEMYNLEQLSGIPLWYAQYSKVPNFDYHFSIWQYSNKGNVAGINGSVDMNIMFKKKEGKK